MRRRTGFGGAEGAERLGSLEGVGDVGFVVGGVECDAVPAALVLLVADAEAGKSIKGRGKGDSRRKQDIAPSPSNNHQQTFLFHLTKTKPLT